MSRPFRVGDRVIRIIDGGYYGIVKGGIYTVSKLKNEDHVCLEESERYGFGHSKYSLELVSTKPFVKEEWL